MAKLGWMTASEWSAFVNGAEEMARLAALNAKVAAEVAATMAALAAGSGSAGKVALAA